MIYISLLTIIRTKCFVTNSQIHKSFLILKIDKYASALGAVCDGNKFTKAFEMLNILKRVQYSYYKNLKYVYAI